MSHHSENLKMKEDTRKRPVFFFELGASHKELLKDGYEFMRQNRVSISTTTASGMTFTATSARYQDRLVEDLRATYNHKAHSIDFKLNSSSLQAGFINPISGRLVLTKLFSPSATAKADFAFHNYIASLGTSKFKLSFCHQNATFLISAALGHIQHISLAATASLPGISYGLKMKLTQNPTVWDPCSKAAVQVTRPTWDASMIMESDRFNASYVRYLDEAKKIAAGVMISVNFIRHEIDFAAGGSCVIDDMTSVKARIDRRAMLETLLHRRLNDKAHFTISAEFDLKNFYGKPAIGLAVALEL